MKKQRKSNILDKKYLNENFLFNTLTKKIDFVLPFQENELHKTIKYELNEYGYRSSNFIQNEKLLTLGCSHTFGTGLPMEYVWNSILSEKLNIRFANLAKPGDSAMGQVQKFFAYCKEFGHPEMIVAFFPLYRMPAVAVPDYITTKKMKNVKDIFVTKSCWLENDFLKIAKAPYVFEEIMPIELPFYYTMLAVDILKQYCKSNNIKLIWSIYEYYEYIALDDNFKNNLFFDDYCHNPSPDNILNCNSHDDLKNNLFFFNASDIENNQKPHFGLHQHIHIADNFYKKITGLK